MNKSIERRRVLKKFFEIDAHSPNEARVLIKKLDYKSDHLLLTCIAQTYFDENRLRLAERFIIKAYQINQTCPYTLWIMALVRWDYGQTELAISLFKEIISLGIRPSVLNQCTDMPFSIEAQKEHALARINDSKFQLYRLLIDTSPSLGKKYLKEYEKGLKKGYFSLMTPYYKRNQP
jgi:hypothetical protein